IFVINTVHYQPNKK
ncbi:TPA: 23S rRNA methylase leader peptide ErmCL, partial [Enterococcus faecium]|nr:23S rRNA methylase leader peptide ErmCL [Enterococcus faecium]